jgi:hypothetical protein
MQATTYADMTAVSPNVLAAPQATTLQLPLFGFVTAAAISLNLWGWILYSAWRLAF